MILTGKTYTLGHKPIYSDTNLYTRTQTYLLLHKPIYSDTNLYTRTQIYKLGHKPIYSDTNLYTRTQTCLSIAFSTTNPMWTCLGSSSSFRTDKPSTNRLNHGTVYRRVYLYMYRSTMMYLYMCRSTMMYLYFCRSTMMYLYMCRSTMMYLYLCRSTMMYLKADRQKQSEQTRIVFCLRLLNCYCVCFEYKNLIG
jgi:hypothetical protein